MNLNYNCAIFLNTWRFHLVDTVLNGLFRSIFSLFTRDSALAIWIERTPNGQFEGLFRPFVAYTDKAFLPSQTSGFPKWANLFG